MLIRYNWTLAIGGKGFHGIGAPGLYSFPNGRLEFAPIRK